VILAGGRSRRFGSNKALAAFHGTRLVDHLVGRLRDQTAGPIAVNASDALGDETHVSDRIEGDIGPLAGLHAALCWAGENQQDAVITTPVDTPMLPADYVARLAETGAPAVAHYNDRTHALHGIWPTALRDRLEACIQGGMRAARDWCAAIEAATCPFPATPGHDPFFNVNTPEDLARLLKDQPVSPR
jgi:molybdopterin-guanine dinucleotide biosynthesis protein A